MLHLSVKNLSQNFESLKELLASIKFEFKVICLTETWCTVDLRNETLFNLENYTLINQVRKHSRGGGICVFIHNSLTFNLRSDLGTNINDIESLPIEKINKKSKDVVISAYYRQLAGDFKQYKTYLESIDNQPVILSDIKHILKVFLRILTGKKHPKIKLQCLRKIRIWTFGSLVHQINSF